jgi:DNA-binding NarL/FixJ family response regulator
MILSGIRSKLAAESTVTAVVPAKRVFIGMALRESARPYIVIYGIDMPPAATTLEGSSALRDGEFQIDSYADTAVDARLLSNIVQAALQDFRGTLPDGSSIQFVETTADGDDTFAVGGSSFIFRSFFRITAFYTEA